MFYAHVIKPDGIEFKAFTERRMAAKWVKRRRADRGAIYNSKWDAIAAIDNLYDIESVDIARMVLDDAIETAGDEGASWYD